MFPLDFEEFLWVMRNESTYPLIHLCFKNGIIHLLLYMAELL